LELKVLERFRTSEIMKRLGRALLAFDAWVNTAVFTSGRKSRAAYVSFAAFMDRFHARGWRRVGVELACEGLTLGLGGAILALFLAIPAFRETSDDWLKKQDLAVTFLDRYGNEVGRRGIKHDDSVTLDQLPEHLLHAVLATEDRRFYEHFGIDVIGTFRALTVNARSTTVVQGGSSITQQLAKNLFLSNERTIERKVKEAYLALWLEFHLTKREILKLYLDRAYMGGGTFGVQAAAEFYFAKNVRDVTLPEAAMLAGLFKAPTKFAPHVNLPAARARANDVLNNLVDAGYMTQSQIFAALRNPATPVDRRRDVTPDWYLDYAFEEVKKLADARKLGDDRVLTVRTALDNGLQKHAESVIEDQLRQNGKSYHAKQSATVVMDSQSGAVRAIVGGRDYGASQFNRATDALRQPGSSFKPYVYLTALMSGKYKPTTVVVDGPVCLGNWCPRNYGGNYYGAIPLVGALTKSLNTVAVKLSIGIGDSKGGDFQRAKQGRAKIIDVARRLGLTTPLPDTVSLPIGADEVTVMDHTSAYAAFANGGKRVPPYAAVEIFNSRGESIYRRDRDNPPPQQVVPAKSVIDLVSMMTKVVEEGTGKRAQLGENIQVAGKTGTTNGYKDAWFCGYTGNLTECVWFGNDDDTAMNNMTGGSLPAQTWHDIMVYAHNGIELKPLPGMPAPPPGPAVLNSGTVAELGAAQHPAQLSRRASDAIISIEDLLRTADGQRAATTASGGVLAEGGTNPALGIGVRATGGRIEVR
jgi:penicillin-binding protein 1A